MCTQGDVENSSSPLEHDNRDAEMLISYETLAKYRTQLFIAPLPFSICFSNCPSFSSALLHGDILNRSRRVKQENFIIAKYKKKTGRGEGGGGGGDTNVLHAVVVRPLTTRSPGGRIFGGGGERGGFLRIHANASFDDPPSPPPPALPPSLQSVAKTTLTLHMHTRNTKMKTGN